jgi:hypothetical protein
MHDEADVGFLHSVMVSPEIGILVVVAAVVGLSKTTTA